MLAHGTQSVDGSVKVLVPDRVGKGHWQQGLRDSGTQALGDSGQQITINKKSSRIYNLYSYSYEPLADMSLAQGNVPFLLLRVPRCKHRNECPQLGFSQCGTCCSFLKRVELYHVLPLAGSAS